MSSGYVRRQYGDILFQVRGEFFPTLRLARKRARSLIHEEPEKKVSISVAHRSGGAWISIEQWEADVLTNPAEQEKKP